MTYWNWNKAAKNGLGLLLSLLVMLFLLRWFEHKQVYFPSSSFETTGEALKRPWQDVYFDATDGTKLNGWFFPVEPSSSRAQFVVLLCHGNAGNISHRLEICDVLLQLGRNVFAFDYRGYGKSSGKPSEAGTYQDAEAALQWLQKKGFAPANIVALGESLGGGVAGELALRASLGGLILQSTFTSVPDLGAELYPWLPVKRLCKIHYDTRGKLPRIKAPVLVMHSRNDSMVGFQHSEKNFAAANEPKLFWEVLGDHNDTLQAGLERYREGIEKFFKLIDVSRAPKP